MTKQITFEANLDSGTSDATHASYGVAILQEGLTNRPTEARHRVAVQDVGDSFQPSVRRIKFSFDFDLAKPTRIRVTLDGTFVPPVCEHDDKRISVFRFSERFQSGYYADFYINEEDLQFPERVNAMCSFPSSNAYVAAESATTRSLAFYELRHTERYTRFVAKGVYRSDISDEMWPWRQVPFLLDLRAFRNGEPISVFGGTSTNDDRVRMIDTPLQKPRTYSSGSVSVRWEDRAATRRQTTLLIVVGALLGLATAAALEAMRGIFEAAAQTLPPRR